MKHPIVPAPSAARPANRVMVVFYLCALAVGVSLVVVLSRFESLQSRFLEVNFDSVHTTRTLLKTGILMNDLKGQLLRLEADPDPEVLDWALSLLDTAIAYETAATYFRPELQERLRQRMLALQRDLKGLRISQAARRTADWAALTQRVAAIVVELEDMERDRWGMLSAINNELGEHMEANVMISTLTEVFLGLIMLALAWAMLQKARAERLLMSEKRLLEQENRQRLELTRELSHQASHDALTGLVNRREFERRLEAALAAAGRDDAQQAVLYLDLDQFKVVNDTCGHIAGDHLLRQITIALRAPLRSSDTLARLGGDEFGVLLENCPQRPAQAIAEKLRQAISAVRFEWEGRIFTVGVSIGLVCIEDASMTLTEVLSRADAACYIAKDNGRNAIHVYRRDDAEQTRRHVEMESLVNIQQALLESRFCLFRQSIVAVNPASADGVEHFELLVRMLDKDGALVPPSSFIPAAERYGLMPQVDRWVVAKALETLQQQLARRPKRRLMCGINISGTALSDESFQRHVERQFAHTGVPHDMVCFEITETAAIANLARAEAFINRMRELGCRFALDDFGSGMSSFSYLKCLPVDYLKIDGGFVKDMVNDRIDRAMVHAIHGVGRIMGIRTIAEYVENEAVLKQLAKLGVDYAQGYGIDRPTYWAGGRRPVEKAPAQATAAREVEHA
jgi:diguanylate cyclase (GGDEF)-like protein